MPTLQIWPLPPFSDLSAALFQLHGAAAFSFPSITASWQHRSSDLWWLPYQKKKEWRLAHIEKNFKKNEIQKEREMESQKENGDCDLRTCARSGRCISFPEISVISKQGFIAGLQQQGFRLQVQVLGRGAIFKVFVYYFPYVYIAKNSLLLESYLASLLFVVNIFFLLFKVDVGFYRIFIVFKLNVYKYSTNTQDLFYIIILLNV